MYRINILLFNKDIYVINFALGRCWPEKSRFLGPYPGLSWSSEPAVEGIGCDLHHWRVGSVAREKSVLVLTGGFTMMI